MFSDWILLSNILCVLLALDYPIDLYILREQHYDTSLLLTPNFVWVVFFLYYIFIVTFFTYFHVFIFIFIFCFFIYFIAFLFILFYFYLFLYFLFYFSFFFFILCLSFVFIFTLLFFVLFEYNIAKKIKIYNKKLKKFKKCSSCLLVKK